MAEQIGFSYFDYILKNPLYLHNSEENYKITVQKVKSIENLQENYLKRKMKNYLNKIEEQENELINAVGGQDKINMILEDISIRNENVPKLYEILNEIFPTTGEITRHTFSSSKGKSYFGISGQKLEVELNKKKEISDIKTIGDDFQKAFDEYIEYMNNLYLRKKEYDEKLTEMINLEVVTSKTGNTPIKTLCKYLDQFEIKKGISADYLEALRHTTNLLSSLTGQFDEGLKVAFTSTTLNEIKINFEDINKNGNLTVSRADIITPGKNKKPDLIVHGGKFNIDDNPLTISKKSTMGNEVILQKSGLMSIKGQGLYEYFNNEEKGLGNYYVYLKLNNTYWKDGEIEKIINNLNKFLAFLFISGNSNDTKKERAVYFIATKREGSIVKEVYFAPMKDIIMNLLLNSGIKIADYNGTKKDLEDLLEEKHTAFNLMKTINSKIEYDYNFLSTSEHILNFMRSHQNLSKIIQGERMMTMPLTNIKNLEGYGKYFEDIFKGV